MQELPRDRFSLLPPSAAAGHSGVWLCNGGVSEPQAGAGDHPDHDTIATFRRRFRKDIEALFVQVLLRAREMGVLKLGMVALDRTKIHANASRHSALSYEHAGKIAAQLKAEVAELLAKAATLRSVLPVS